MNSEMVNFLDQSEKKKGDSASWLFTFSDLITLMLVFFVMLYSMSKPKQDEWEAVVSAIERAFDIDTTQERKVKTPNAPLNVQTLREKQAVDLDYLKTLLESKFNERDIDLFNDINRFDDRLVLSLPSDLLFESNSDVIKVEGKKILFTVVGILAKISNQIELIGHSDPGKIRSGPYPSNWELSLARALSIEQAFENMGYKKNIIVQGYADGDYDFIGVGLPEIERKKAARKVDIIIHRSRSRQ